MNDRKRVHSNRHARIVRRFKLQIRSLSAEIKRLRTSNLGLRVVLSSPIAEINVISLEAHISSPTHAGLPLQTDVDDLEEFRGRMGA